MNINAHKYSTCMANMEFFELADGSKTAEFDLHCVAESEIVRRRAIEQLKSKDTLEEPRP